MKNYVFALLAVTAVSISSCSTTEETIQDAVDEAQENYSEQEAITESGINLDDLRTRLSDSYAYRENQIPEQFNQIKEEEKPERNLYEGYRIQIYSSEQVADADTVASNFRAWADTTLVNYDPDTYVFFKTPYYRVHVGDFHERSRAISFSNIVKRYFRDAWVVYDRVVPARVAADTIDFETQ